MNGSHIDLCHWTTRLLVGGVFCVAGTAAAEENMKLVNTALNATTLSGYISTSAVWNPANGPVAIAGMAQSIGAPAMQDGFNLDVVSIALEKPITEGGWSAGYRVQMLFGPGANARGTFLAGSPSSEVAFNEAYVALNVPVGNGIVLNLGQIGTYNGYEAYDVYKNPNFTKSYGFYNETSAHTGVKATYQFNESITLSGAVGNTGSANDGFSSRVDARSSFEAKKAYLGMLTLTAPDSLGILKGATLSFGALTGPGNGTVDSGKSTQQYYIGGNIPTPLKGLSVGYGLDYTALAPGGYAKSAAGYLRYAATEKLKFNTRVDYGDSNVTGWYGGNGTYTQNDAALISVTETIEYTLWKNVLSRAEFRYDTSLDAANKPYNNRGDNYLLLANLVYQF